jgi:hypothetical protein
MQFLPFNLNKSIIYIKINKEIAFNKNNTFANFIYNVKFSQKIQLTNYLCGAEYHSTGHKLCSHSVDSQHFMEPEGSWPTLQNPSNFTHPEPDQSSPQHSILSLKGPS